MFLTVSYGCWLPLAVSLISMELLHVSHCLLLLLGLSHFLYSLMKMPHVSHCFSWLLAVSHFLLYLLAISHSFSGLMELLKLMSLAAFLYCWLSLTFFLSAMELLHVSLCLP